MKQILAAGLICLSSAAFADEQVDVRVNLGGRNRVVFETDRTKTLDQIVAEARAEAHHLGRQAKSVTISVDSGRYQFGCVGGVDPGCER